MNVTHRRAGPAHGIVAKWAAVAVLIGGSCVVEAYDSAAYAASSVSSSTAGGESVVTPGNAPHGGADTKRVSAFGQYAGYSPSLYKQYKLSSVYVPARDGTRLAIDIYRPAVNGKPVRGKLPTVFEFTRYWRATELPDGRIKTPYFGYLWPGQTGGALPGRENWAVDLVEHGYVVVIGDIRGTGSSFGTNPGIYTATEAKDEYDLIEWMARQPWCDGKIGLTGDSYTGTNEYTALTQRPPHLKAIFPAVSNFELYSTAVSNGVFLKGGILSMYNTLVRLGSASQTKLPLPPPVDADPSHVLRDQARAGQGKGGFSGYTSFLYSPILDHVAAELDLKTVEDRIRVLASPRALIRAIADRPELQRELMSVGYFRGPGSFDFSAPGDEKSISPSSIFDVINETGIPIYVWSGWQDGFPDHAFLFFANIKTPKKLTVGPWAHSPFGLRGDLREEEAIRLRAVEELRWFDYWLKGIDNGIMKEPSINYAIVSGPTTWHWRTANVWPVPKAVATNMYFQAGRVWTVRSVNDGLLSMTRPVTAGGHDSIIVDYTATTGTETRFDYETGGGHLFYPDMTHNDAKGLTYTTIPLKRDLQVVGFPIVTLYATSTAPDAEFDVYLEDVDQYGFSTYLTAGSIRALNRTLGTAPYNDMGLPWPTNGKADAEAVAPLSQGIAVIRFPLQPAGWLFKAGHRIRVTIQGADADSNLTFPTVPPPKVTVVRDPALPSRITLPVLPSDR